MFFFFLILKAKGKKKLKQINSKKVNKEYQNKSAPKQNNQNHGNILCWSTTARHEEFYQCHVIDISCGTCWEADPAGVNCIVPTSPSQFWDFALTSS